MICMESDSDEDCNLGWCTTCPLYYEQGTWGEKVEALRIVLHKVECIESEV